MPNPKTLAAAELAADPRPYFPAESRTVRRFVECALEAGLSHTDAVKLAVGIYKELDVQARASATLDPLPPAAIVAIRGYACAVLRSGSTFSSFEIATRAIASYRCAADALERLAAEWDRQTVTGRLKWQKMRRDAAAKMMARHAAEKSRVTVGLESQAPAPDDQDPGLGMGDKLDAPDTSELYRWPE